MAAERLPLPRRVNAALTDRAYAMLRTIKARHGLGHNHLLMVLLGQLVQLAKPNAPDRVFDERIEHYGAPALQGD